MADGPESHAIVALEGELETDDEQEENDSDFREDLHLLRVRDPSEPRWTDEESGQNQTHHRRNSQTGGDQQHRHRARQKDHAVL